MSFESSEPCVVCGLNGKGVTCFHHVLSKKAFPEYRNEPKNLISVCQSCHNLFHSKGTKWMADKHIRVHFWLVSNGFEYCDFFKKWRENWND